MLGFPLMRKANAGIEPRQFSALIQLLDPSLHIIIHLAKHNSISRLTWKK